MCCSHRHVRVRELLETGRKLAQTSCVLLDTLREQESENVLMKAKEIIQHTS